MKLKKLRIKKKISNSTLKAAPILLIGIILTGLITYYTYYVIEEEANRDFTLVCQEIKTKITTRLHAHAQLLRSGAAYILVSDSVTRQDWHDFVENSKIEKNLPGIQGVGFSLVIPKNSLQSHIKRIRREGFPEYTVKPEGDREDYTSIIYLEPFDYRNKRAFGYDMFSEAVRREAMEQARDYDIAALTGKVLLVQETNEDLQAGSLMYVPVYDQNKPTSTVAEHRDAIIGWVYSPYRMNNLMNGILGHWDNVNSKRIHLQIYDNDSITPDALLFNSQQNNIVNSRYNRTLIIPITFNGKTWTLYFEQSKDSIFHFSSKVALVLFGSLIIILLVFFLTLLTLNTKQKALQIAEKLTTDLKESENEFRNLFQTVPIPLCYVNNESGKILMFNEKFSEIFAYSSTDIPTLKEWWQLAYPEPEYRKWVLSTWSEAVELASKTGSQIQSKEYKVTTKKGNELDIVISGKVLSKYFIASFIDMTDYKLSEKALQISEKRFRAMFMEAPLGIALIHSLNGKISEANSMYEKIVGRSIEELSKIDWMTITHPDDIQADLDNMSLLNSGKISSFQMEKRYIHKNGDIVWINMTIAPIEVEDKANPLHLCMVEDITQRKAIEINLKVTNDSLEEMVYIASHDLQVPLVSMEGYASELLEDYGEKLDKNGKFCLTRLQVNAQNMHKLVLSLLDISRLNTKKYPYEHFDLQPIIKKILTDLNLVTQQQNASIRVLDLPQLFGDKQRIETVFRNIITNALSYGGKLITIGFDDDVIFVKDDGIGIPKNQLKTIFNTGERLLLIKNEGIGMGLTFCNKVIEQHEWKIWAESEGTDKGTTIKIKYK